MASVPTATGILVKIGAGIASACILALGGAAVENQATDAAQQVHIDQLEDRLAKIDEIDKNVNHLNNKVDVLIQRVDDNGFKPPIARSR